MKVEGIELGKKIRGAVVPYGRKTFSITTYEKGLVLKKSKQIIILDDTFGIQILGDSIRRFWKDREK